MAAEERELSSPLHPPYAACDWCEIDMQILPTMLLIAALILVTTSSGRIRVGMAAKAADTIDCAGLKVNM